MRPHRRPIQSPIMPTRIWPVSKSARVAVSRNQTLLTDNYTADFQVVDGLSPSLVAILEVFPARLESGLQERPDVANGEKHVPRRHVSNLIFDLRFR